MAQTRETSKVRLTERSDTMQGSKRIMFAVAISTAISIGNNKLARCAPIEEKNMTTISSSDSSIPQQKDTPSIVAQVPNPTPISRLNLGHYIPPAVNNPYVYPANSYTYVNRRNIRLEKITRQLHKAKRATDSGNKDSDEANKGIRLLIEKIVATTAAIYIFTRKLLPLSDEIFCDICEL